MDLVRIDSLPLPLGAGKAIAAAAIPMLNGPLMRALHCLLIRRCEAFRFMTKMAIHPVQIEVIDRAFSVSEEQRA